MQELAGKAAFVTGGASGIGLALGRACARAGMRVMLADIEGDALDRAVEGLRGSGPEVRGTLCDVADPASMERAAEATFAAFGRVHLLCNNAGVGAGSGIENIALDTWRWVLDVNLMGVLHGVRCFLPHMRAHGAGGHVVNTASMAGLTSGFGFSPYATSKAAIISMSEGLARQLAPLGIGVSVLCPGFVNTRIPEATRNRQPRYGAAVAPEPGSPGAKMLAELARLTQAGMDPDAVAAEALEAVRENRLYVFTHAGPEWRADLSQRFDTILAAMDDAAARQKG